MSRQDEIKEVIESLDRMNSEHEIAIKANNKTREKYLAKLDAIEAQERKPREFVLGLNEAGQLASISRYGSDVHYHLHNVFGPPRNYIPLIEKLPVKPIVVTREMSRKFLDCLTSGDVNPTTVSNGLKAAFNIDAEPSND